MSQRMFFWHSDDGRLLDFGEPQLQMKEDERRRGMSISFLF